MMEHQSHRHKIELREPAGTRCCTQFGPLLEELWERIWHISLNIFFFFTKTLHLILNRLVIAHIVLLNRALFVSKSDHVSQKCVACCLFSGFLLTDSAAHFLCLLTVLDS